MVGFSVSKLRVIVAWGLLRLIVKLGVFWLSEEQAGIQLPHELLAPVGKQER